MVKVLNALKGNLVDVVPEVARTVEKACATMNGLAMATAASLNQVPLDEEPENGDCGSPSTRSTP